VWARADEALSDEAGAKKMAARAAATNSSMSSRLRRKTHFVYEKNRLEPSVPGQLEAAKMPSISVLWRASCFGDALRDTKNDRSEHPAESVVAMPLVGSA
jgi:hypothetical protein